MPKLLSPTKYYDNWMWRISDPVLFAKAFKYNLKLRKKWNIHIEPCDDGLRIWDNSGNKLFILSHKRLEKYKHGIESRLKHLSNEYMLEHVPLQDGDTVIDCGANIGEIGKLLSGRYPSIRYFAIDPGQPEIDVCRLNNPTAVCEHAALWCEDTVLELFNKSDTADSSVLAFSGYESTSSVTAKTLDTFCRENQLEVVSLLKLEAEGAEPEILAGAADMLRNIKYIAVDCGFERGFEKTSTLPDVSNMLISNGFEMRSVYAKNRLVALFANKALA